MAIKLNKNIDMRGIEENGQIQIHTARYIGLSAGDNITINLQTDSGGGRTIRIGMLAWDRGDNYGLAIVSYWSVGYIPIYEHGTGLTIDKPTAGTTDLTLTNNTNSMIPIIAIGF